MKAIPEDRQIYISGRIWHEIFAKIDLTPFIYALHERIDLSKYGEGLRKFYFTFIIVKPNDSINLPAAHFSRKNREADISVQIPYDKVMVASDFETVKLMEAAFLKGIDELHTLPIKGDFDIAQFRQDVEAIFSQENWHLQAVAA